MTLFDDKLWSKTSPEAHAEDLKQIYGEAAWVDAYLMRKAAKSVKAQRFATCTLKALRWESLISVAEVPHESAAEAFLAYVEKPLAVAQKRLQDAEAAEDQQTAAYLREVVELIEIMMAEERE